LNSLSPERAAEVLARVGTRTITLGDYAAALERMDPFERMRYQTDDRRQALLDEMINVELLAREAERRGLDRLPATQERVRQFQRDELLRRLRAELPAPSPAAVREYYEQHRAEFFEPERRRAAQIVLGDSALAQRVLNEARGGDAERWRALVREHNPGALGSEGDKTMARPALEVPGDLGMMSAPGTPPAPQGTPRTGVQAGAEPPEAVRRAVFEIPKVGEVYPQLVAHGGRFHVLRLVSLVEARQRTLEEAESAIRLRLSQAAQEQAEVELLGRLRQSISVSIDEAALERVPEPAPAAAPSSAAPPPATP
jgi:peptidyl-prolyl cis-trans isomerase C